MRPDEHFFEDFEASILPEFEFIKNFQTPREVLIASRSKDFSLCCSYEEKELETVLRPQFCEPRRTFLLRSSSEGEPFYSLYIC